MVEYRRPRVPGGCYFFTLALAQRQTSLLTDHAQLLGRCFRAVRERHPYTMDACVVLPDHLHCIWTLPDGDSDYSLRWTLVKSMFSRGLPGGEPVRDSRRRRGERGIWQRRFWEHVIRDDADFNNHVDYIHINPVKHGLVARAIDWPHSSIHRYVREGRCDPGWEVESFAIGLPVD